MFEIIGLGISVLAMLLSLYNILKGPDISLLNEPRFKLVDSSVSTEYIPRVFGLEEVSLVFANYGRKGGSILDIKMDFQPNKEFDEFIESFWESTYPDVPIIIKEGENHVLKFKPSLSTIDWKKYYLNKIIEDTNKIEEAVDKSINQGKLLFEKFYSLLKKEKEIGNISCIASLTAGRLNTRIENKVLFKNFTIKNEFKELDKFFQERIDKWDSLKPVRSELINEFRSYPISLTGELKRNLQLLNEYVSEENISRMALHTSSWTNISRLDYNKVRWFLIEKEKNLKTNISHVYKQIIDYNVIVQEALSLGEFRTQSHIEKINEKRTLLLGIVSNLVSRMDKLLS